MAICVIPTESGSLQVDGASVDQCAGYVLQTTGEYFANQSFWPQLTVAQGVVLSAAILSAWAAAVGIRHLIDLVRN